MAIKVSVIIPVYNAEEHLGHCIDSLISQTLNEVEFIFINDGSKDKSKDIIERYQQLDSRIKLINQKNKGVSIARNNGLKIARGEYVGFVDADDYVQREYYEILYKAARKKNHDVIITNFESYSNGNIHINTYPFVEGQTFKENYIQNDIIPYFLKEDNCNSVCNKLYKRKLIKENNLKFPNQVALGEDGMFNIDFFCFSNSGEYLNYTGYHYREVQGSATRNIKDRDYFKRAIDAYQFKLPTSVNTNLDNDRIQKYKAIKLVKNVMSYIHLYYIPTKELSFFKRYSYIKNMVQHHSVNEALPFYYRDIYPISGRYEKLIIELIKRKSAVGLYLATSYSRFRNK
jgi:glycosyltransferase involved in cell wall biosynthesis